jgi:phage shock protein PspC (stress-responsive transcriptional regulator)
MSDTPNNTRLTRDKNEGMIAGVCAGIAARYGLDVGLVRLVAVLLTVVSLGVGGIIIYVAAWILIPAAGATEAASMGDRRREFTDEVATAADRAAEAAKIAAAHARQAADEIAAVARGVRADPPATSMPAPAAPQTEPGASTTPPAAAADPAVVTDAQEIDPPAGGTQQP